MNSSFSEETDNWDIELPTGFATTRSEYFVQSQLSDSLIYTPSEGSIDSELQLLLQPTITLDLDFLEMDRQLEQHNGEEEEVRKQQNNNSNNDNGKGENPQQDLALVLG